MYFNRNLINHATLFLKTPQSFPIELRVKFELFPCPTGCCIFWLLNIFQSCPCFYRTGSRPGLLPCLEFAEHVPAPPRSCLLSLSTGQFASSFRLQLKMPLSRRPFLMTPSKVSPPFSGTFCYSTLSSSYPLLLFVIIC